MDARFFGGLFEGDSANGVKLGMGLTCGDFWPRPGGCLSLYRGRWWWEIDFGAIMAVEDADAKHIALRAEHVAGETVYYALRSVNGCGEEDAGHGAMVRATFDAAGDLRDAVERDVIGLAVRRAAGTGVRLSWFYRPYHRRVGQWWFKVYCDGARGVMDFEAPGAAVVCAGAGIYSIVYEVSGLGRYRFCVRRESQAGEITGAAVFTEIQVSAPVAADVGQLNVKVV